MASPDEPTPWEVLRRLDDVAKRLETVAVKLDESQERAARTYVRQDVYLAERQAMEANVSDIRTDVTAVDTKLDRDIREIKTGQREEKAARRQVWLAIGTCGVMALIAIAGLIVSIVRG